MVDSVFCNKKVLVLGLAKSGLSAAHLLKKLGARVIVNDKLALENNTEAQALIEEGFQVITGYHPEDLLDASFDFVVKNPGIPYTNPVVGQAEKLAIPILTEVDVAGSILKAKPIAVTGTNGKTTTVSLIYDILAQDQAESPEPKPVYKLGNIGQPVSDLALEIKAESNLVVELSSFQLQSLTYFTPHIAVITNIYSAHLDYHKSREEYVRAKLRITQAQGPDDYLVYYQGQEELASLVKKYSKAQLVPYTDKGQVDKGAYIKDGYLIYQQEPIMALDQVKVSGSHNFQNILAAVCVAKIKGLSNQTIAQAVNHFKGVAHRSQVVGRYEDRLFVNDSKATNSLATQKALEAYDQDTILLVGGLDRQDDFTKLDHALDKVKGVVCFGQTQGKLAQYFKDRHIEDVELVQTVQEAVEVAYDLSKPGQVILFSPACASWDQYANFEERGQDYVEAIQQLVERLEQRSKYGN